MRLYSQVIVPFPTLLPPWFKKNVVNICYASQRTLASFMVGVALWHTKDCRIQHNPTLVVYRLN